ncbi:hypothetical protein ACFV2I_20275 [Streptomyces microflavus]|uniref:hypothetical protein n=1 Tax=Streptomyces microflavus TaxID=1919 RepID=UPI0036613D3E
MTTPCPGCRTRLKEAGRYLCLACWSTLPVPTRRELGRRDRQAFARLRSLHTQLEAGVPLTQITVTTHG